LGWLQGPDGYRGCHEGTAQLSVEAIKFNGVGAWQTKANASIDGLVKHALEDADVRDNRPPSRIVFR